MTAEDLRGKRVTVIGAARSGVAAACLLREHGADVFVTDAAPVGEPFLSALTAEGVAFESGGHTDRALAADFVVTSPGVPSSAPVIRQALAAGLLVYAEIEVASWFCRAPVIAVTGSNGKTTTVSMLGRVFRAAGCKTFVGGNVGRAFSGFAVKAGLEDVVVLEVSSFQLDHVDRFRPRVAVLLNLEADHLDRYGGDFEAYASSKLRIQENQRRGDVFIYNHDDRYVRARVLRRASQDRPKLLAFSRETEVESGAFLYRGTMVMRMNGEEALMPIRDIALHGDHNLSNALAAALAARVTGVPVPAMYEGLSSFVGLPHRLEFVREIDGVRYVNDSKATNVHAVRSALESCDGPLILIAGGRDKGNDYATIRRLVRQKARAVIGFGESAGRVVDELGQEVPHVWIAGSLQGAVHRARALAQAGDVVLFSPGCVSFDMFRDYEERGDLFRKLVRDG